MYRLLIKRILDFITALIGLVVLSPLLILISIVILIDSKGPILFKQKRFGINKQLFTILKFRTMYVNAPQNAPTHLLENPNRHITRVGAFLRKTSLDELPQMVNILIGDMSVIGPRPALWNQHDLISQRDLYGANNLRPGLSGWAQVNGRDELSIEEKAKLDGEYTNKVGFFMDIKCVLLTVLKVLSKKGVVEGKSDTANPQNVDAERVSD